MNKKLFVTLAALVATASLHAVSGIFGAYIGITAQGAGEVIYGENQPGPNTTTAFSGANLGTVNEGETVTLSFAEVLTFKNGGSDIFGAAINARVYPTGTPTGSFTETSINFGGDAPFNDVLGNGFGNGGDQVWSSVSSSTDLASGLDAGTYDVEIFWQAASSDGDHFVNNGGSNFTGSFTVVPEPSTYAAILGGAILAIAIVRRRLRK